MEKRCFCQSCAMPMEGNEELKGINKDGTRNSDYCIHCYKEGDFTAHISMEEMIDFCVPMMVEHNQNITKEDARKMMNEVFPKLKRWSK